MNESSPNYTLPLWGQPKKSKQRVRASSLLPVTRWQTCGTRRPQPHHVTSSYIRNHCVFVYLGSHNVHTSPPSQPHILKHQHILQPGTAIQCRENTSTMKAVKYWNGQKGCWTSLYKHFQNSTGWGPERPDLAPELGVLSAAGWTK